MVELKKHYCTIRDAEWAGAAFHDAVVSPGHATKVELSCLLPSGWGDGAPTGHRVVVVRGCVTICCLLV